MKLTTVSVLAFCATLATATNSTIACYSNVDWAVKIGSSQQQSPQQCLESCSGYSIIGLKNGNQCYCVKNTPSINEVATALCNMPCSGSESAICGGDSLFSVYTSDQVSNLGSSSSSNSFSSSAGSSSASSSSSTSASDSGSDSASKTASSGSASSASTTSGSASASSGSATSSAKSSAASSVSSSKESSTSAKTSSTASSKSTSSKAMGAQLGVSVQGVIGVLAPLLLL
ncbi:hypothetical protein ABC855_g3517 [[Candida] zeylanoides]